MYFSLRTYMYIIEFKFKVLYHIRMIRLILIMFRYVKVPTIGRTSHMVWYGTGWSEFLVKMDSSPGMS